MLSAPRQPVGERGEDLLGRLPGHSAEPSTSCCPPRGEDADHGAVTVTCA